MPADHQDPQGAMEEALAEHEDRMYAERVWRPPLPRMDPHQRPNEHPTMILEISDRMTETARNIAAHNCNDACTYCRDHTMWLGEMLIHIVLNTDANTRRST